MLTHRALTETVIGLAIEIHRTVGPGLLESVYRECLHIELERAEIPHVAEAVVPVTYKGHVIPLGFRADLIVDKAIVVEIKALSALTPAHDAQLLTYLRMSQVRVGLLMNFHAPRLKDGLRRLVV